MYLIGGLVLIGLVLGAYAVYESQKATIATLTGDVSSLQTANKADQDAITHLQSDMKLVQAQYQKAETDIQTASSAASKAQQQIRSQNLNKAAKANPTALTTQLNTSLQTTFDSWKALSQ